MNGPPGPPPDSQLLRLAIQNLACAPQAQRRYVQLGWMPRAIGNLRRVGANVDDLVGEGGLDAEAAKMVGELRDQVERGLASHDDFLEEKDAAPRDFLFGNALENDDWEAIRQQARKIHSRLVGEGSVFAAINAK